MKLGGCCGFSWLRFSGSSRRAAARSFVASFTVLAMAIAVAVVFVFSLSFVFTSRTDSSDLGDSGFDSGSFGGFGSTRRTVLALKSDPLKPRLDQIRKQADDHRTLALAYASYARKLKLENSRLVRVFFLELDLGNRLGPWRRAPSDGLASGR